MTTESTNGASALQRASALCDLGRWDDAARQLRTILAADPHNTWALCLIAQAQIGQTDLDQALRSSLAAISDNPADEWPHRLASLALSGLGRHSEAVTMARDAVRLAPHAAPCHIVLADVLAQKGSDLSEARAAADRAVSLAPLDAGSHIAVGMVAAKDDRTPEAGDAYRRALALDPDNWVAHNELARLMPQSSRFDAGGLARAAGGYASAVRANPQTQVSRGNIDVVLHNLLVRTTAWIFLIGWFAIQFLHFTNHGFARVVPALLLIFPALMVTRFAFVLAPSTRTYLLGRLRAALVVRVLVCDALASAGLVMGAASPQSAANGFALAAGSAFLALVMLRVSAQRQLRRDSGSLGRGSFAGNTGVLISRSCTTGWGDWIHGELWLTETALIRSRLSLRQTKAHGLGVRSPTVDGPRRQVDVPGYLERTRLTAAHSTNRYFSLTGISWAVLHRGRVVDRLTVTLDTGVRYKLLWLSADPAFDVLCETLPGMLRNRFIVE